MKKIEVEIVKILGEHKRRYSGNAKVAPGFKRVQAIVKGRNGNETRHVDTKDEKIGYMKVGF